MNEDSLSAFRQRFGGSTLSLFLLLVLTSGIYNYVWLSERRVRLKDMTGKDPFNPALLILAAVAEGFAIPLVQSINDPRVQSAMVTLAMLAHVALLIVISFRLAAFLEEETASRWGGAIHFNRVLTFFFSILYLNYKLNGIEGQTGQGAA